MHKGQFSESYYLYLGISCSRAYTAVAESFLPLLMSQLVYVGTNRGPASFVGTRAGNHVDESFNKNTYKIM